MGNACKNMKTPTHKIPNPDLLQSNGVLLSDEAQFTLCAKEGTSVLSSSCV